MKKVYEASTPGFSRVMSNVASLFSSRTMSALPAVATLLCLSFVGTNIAYAQPCAGVSCDISFANLPTPIPPVGMPAEITFCLNSQGTGQITSQLMGGYTSSSNGTCCTIVRVWENAAATNPLTPADADYDVDCTDIGRTINVWVTRETNVPPIQGGPGRSAPLPFAIYIADCTPPNIVCPAPQTLLCLDDYTNSLPPNPMTYDDFNNLSGGASVTDNADDCGPTGFEVSYTDVISNLVCLNGFTVTRTYVAKDATGWTASCTQVITVSDNQPPFFTNLPQDLTLNCPRINAGGLTYGLDVLAIQVAIQNWLNNYGGGTVDDSCPGGFTQNVVLCLLGQGLIGCQTTSPATGLGVWNQMPEACSPQPREVQVGFFVTDACGNEAFAVAKVILVDDIDPTITALPGGNSFSVTCENLVPLPNPLAVVANDNCTGTPPPGPNYAQLIREWVSDVPSAVASPTCGNRTIVRTYRVTDCAGNSATRSQTITVNDNVLPVWGPNPSALLLSCDDPDLEDKIDTWLADNGGADATDNCNGVTISADYASGAAVLAAMAAWCPGNTPTRSVNVTFSLVDGCGNAAANRVVAVTLYDYSAPNADPIPNATAQCNPSEVPNATLTGITDNCTASGDVIVTPQPDQLISAGNGCAASPRVYVRNYRLTDCAGNTRDIPQIIVVADTQAPNWTVDPSPLTLTSCPPSNTDIQNWLDSEGTTGIATDNCGTVNFRTIPATVAEIRALLGPCAPFAGSVTVTFVAEDLCGNSSTKTAVLTVEDNVNPSAGNPATISVKCISEIPAPNIAVVPGVSDACSPAGTITVKYERDSTFGNLPGCPGNVYQFFHIYSIQDCSGNWIERAQRFNVSDDVEPNVNCKAVTVSLDANGTVEVCAEQFDDNSADNCAGDLTYEFSRDIINDGINFSFGPYTECKDFTCADIANIATCAANTNNSAQIAVRLRVIDACGNVSGFCTTNLTVVDDINPTIDCPDDREVPLSDEGDYDCQTAVEIEHPTPADNCSVLCYEMEVQKEIDGVFVTIDPATGAPAPNYRQPVVAGDIATYTFEKGPFCGVNANDEVRRDDEYIIIYYIRDEHGNSNTCQYKITIVDDLAPVFTLCPSQPIIEAQATAGDCYQFKCWEPPTWYDNCQFPYFGEGSGYCPIPTLVVTTSDPSVMVDTIGDDHCALFPVGETQVYYTVTDFCGNSATCTVTVIISDIEDPMAMCVPVKTVNLLPLYPGPGFTTLTYADIDAGSTDNCGLCDKEVGRVYTPGGPILYGPQVYLDCNDVANSPITVYLRVKDCGQPIQNESVCETQVTVLDYQQPTIASCPADIVQCTDIDACNAVVTYNIPTFNDGCNSQHNGTLQSGLASGETFPIGETLVVYDYTSPDNGFNVICQFNVTIEDCQAPNMVCPPDVTLTCLEPLCCPEDFTGGTLTDNCGVTLLQSSDFDNNLSHCTYDGVHVVVRTYTAWDAAGNTSTCQRTYTWTEDTELPVLVQKPGDLSFECAADVPAPPVQSATDNCGTVNIDFVEVVQNNLCVNQTVIIRTWTATDLCGNTTQHVQTITVNDDDVPTFSNEPSDFSSDCSEDVPAVDAPDVDDNCDVYTVEFSESTAPGGCEDNFVITRTWVATDICGNASTYVQTITIEDETDPVIADVPAGYDVQCAGDVLELPQDEHPTITDNCVQVNVDYSESVVPGGCEDKLTVVRRWVATDQCGNASVAFQIINVNDDTDPVLADLPDATVSVPCAADVPAVAAVSATDNCGEPLTIDFSEVEVPGACVNQYVITRTWTAEDDCGNSTSFVQTITVNDDVAPTFSNKPADYSADCSEDVQPVVAPDVDDNCDVYTVDFSETTAPGGCEDNFVITRTWVATDICGNASTYVQTVTIEDDIAPVFSNVPAGESHDCSQDVPAVVHPDVLDNCSQVVVDFSETVAPGGCEDKFTVTRTWVATDACGNQAVTQQVISIFDNEAPVLGNLPDPLVIEDCAQDVPLPALVTASDNCGQLLDVELTEINIPGTCHDRFSVLRRWTAQDACGNITAFVQLITIIDNQAPVLTNTPQALVNVECAEDVPAMPVPPVGATDNCGAPIDVEFVEIEIPGICANQYSIIRRWTAEDACGNISTFVQRININDTEAPELTNLPAALVEVDCADEVPAMPNPPVGATDNCGAPVDVEFSEVEIPGNCPNQYSITRTWTAEDVCGNTTVFVQTINIFDDEAPVLTVTPVDRTYECYDEVPAAPIDQQAIDNCDIAFIDFSESVEGGTNQDPNWSCPNNVTITRRWVATDLCGNTVEHIQEIRVHDEIPPSWVDFDPKDRHYDCLDDVLPAPDQQTLAADNCEVVVVDFLETRADDSCQNQVTIIRRWEATDLCGNKSTRWQYLYVRDTIAPIFRTTPSDRTFECSEDVPVAPIQIAEDNCQVVSVDFAETTEPGGCLNQYVITRRWYAYDVCGNTAEHWQTITVNDNIAPTWTSALPADVTVDCGEDVTPATLTASDNCAAPVDLDYNEDILPGAGPNDGVRLVRTWTATDACGNSIVHTQVVTINDTEAPVLGNLPPATVSVECSEEVPAVAAVTYTDNCQGTVDFDFTEVEVPGTCPNQYQIVRTWTATDFAGNTTQFVQTITINDTEAPQWNNVIPVVWINEIHYDNVGTDAGEFIEVAGTGGVDLSNYSLVLYNGANGLQYGSMSLNGVLGNQSNGFGAASFSYPVNGVQNGSPDGIALVLNNTMVLQFLSYEGSFLAVDGPAAGMMSTDIGVQEDGANPIGTSLSLIGTGNVYANFSWSGPSAASPGTLNNGQTMTAPAGFALPLDVAVQCGEDVPMPVVLQATDNCNAPVDVEFNEVFAPGAGPNDGFVITRTWTAEDDCGNAIVHTQVITVNDTQDPTLGNLPAATVNVVCAEDVPAVADVTYTDNCEGTVDLDFFETILPGDCAHRFTLVRTWTATDFAGNTTQFVQTINVNDNVAPTWTSALPADVTLQCGENVTPATMTASDNCAGAVLVEFNETILPGAGPNDGNLLVRTWTAYDVCGNSIQHTQEVYINDTVDPVLLNTPAATVNVVCAENVPAVANVTASDNCQGTIDADFNETILPGDCAHRFTLVRTWTATDFAGNSTQFVQTINVNDNVAPTWTSALPADVTLQCGENVTPATLTASDNCSGVVVIEMNETILPGAGPNDGNLLARTWTAYDVCGNSIQHTQTIYVNDTQAPALQNTPAATVNVVCSEDVPAVANVTATDNCLGTVDVDFNETILLGDCVHNFTLTRTWSATDFAGNTTQFVQTINVNDNVAPTWTSVLPADVTLQCGENVTPATLTASDNCSGQVVIEMNETILPGAGPNDGGILTRTWTAYDVCGNSTQHVQTLTILDNVAPVLGNLPVATVNIQCSTDIPAVANVTVSDNCQGTVDMDYTESILLGNCINQYTLTRTWLATDFAGNTAVFVQTINVNDTQAPVWNEPAPTNVSVSCAADVPAAPTQTATDNCGVPVITDFSEIVQPGNCLNRFTLVRTWSVQDDCGNATSRQQTITVSDDIAPVMSCPAPLQAQCSPAEQPPYANLTEFTTAGGTASDNCGLNVNSFGLLSETAAGNVYTRTYRVVDQCGNAGTCQQTVTVLDTEAPVFLNCPTGPLVFGNDPDQCSAKINWPQPVAVDNCSIPTVVQTAGPTAGSVVPVGNYTVTFRATDAQGNVSFCTFQVMVMDTEKPEFDADILMPGDVTVECDAVPAPFVLTNNDVNDNCTPSNLLVITFTEVRTNGNCAFNYTLTRTWRVTDQAGNQLVHTQIVTVRDTKAPTAICKNATVTLDKAGNASITAALINNGSFDNCSAQANLTLTVTPSSFTCANLGNNTVTLTVTDQCGNSATCTAVVTVLEGIGPCVPQYSALTTCAGVNGNATTLDNGQFIDRITVKSLAMQTWTVVSNTGLYLVSSPAPPAAPTPLPVGTAFTMGNLDGIDNDGNGQVDEANEMVFYTLRGVHVDGIGYSITIQNNLGQTATISNKAFYPTPVFLNLDGPFCLNTPPFTIEVADTYGAAGNIVPGSVMINGNASTTFNAAALGVGNHTVMATFDASAQGITTNLVINGVLVGGTVDQALANSGCQQKITKVVQVVATPTTIVCNDMVNVSISNDGGNCVFELSPDNVLEGSYLCDDDYSVVITYPAGTNTYNPADRVDNTHIGKTLNYTLVHSQSGNICWGKIKVEDKEAPKLTCPGPITIACSDPTSPTFTGQVIISDCSPTTSVVTDDFTDFGACVDPRAEIVRLWLVTDASGNQATCTQRITIAAFNLNAVIFPADVTLNCATANSTDPAVTGSPSINGTPIGQGGLCMASISRTDDRYEICPGGYEIIRTWKVRNMCLPLSASNPREHQQVIKVIDTQGPTFDCPAAVTVSTDPFNCCATAALPSVIITETCSYVTSLEYRVIGTDFATGNLVIYEGTGFLSDFAGNNYWVPDTMGNFGLTQCLPRGEYDVTYTATDACGNISKCTFKLYVEDQVPPIAVCDEFTQVALGADGMAFIDAHTFDDGSYDVCESVHFKARRMDANACQSNEFFLDQVKFCCEDINDTILVVFRAYDLPVPAGAIGEDEYENHYNDCMVKVFVEDKIKPLCSAPAQVNVSCEAFDPTLWAYGFATGLDNCCLDTITETRNITLFDTVCNRGTITRTFRVFDCGGNSTTCTQRVIVAYEQDYFVRFPNDVIVTVCDGTGNFGEPTFFGVDCELLGVSHKDDTLKVVPDACYMIERTWEIINWCTYNPNAGCINVPNPNPNPNSQHPSNLPGPTVSPAGTPAPWAPTVVAILPGQTPTNYSTFWSANANCYTYKQIIKIIDTQKPEIANCPASPVDVCDITPNDGNLWNAMYWWDNTIGSHDLCEAPTDLTITATDLCSGPNINARYLLFLDLDGDGDMETLINSAQLPGFNNVQFGNAAGGPGTSRQFDFRPVPANQKYGFALQTTTSGANKTFSVRWNTQQSLNTYVIPELPYGTHKIKWIVDDGCGNEQVCEYTFIVKDCKKPTVVCINGLSVNIMPTKMITLTDKDFLLHTDDNCTPSSKLVTAIRKAGQGTGFPRNPDGTPQTTVTFTCNELGKQNVEVWSIDLAGNADFCVTYVDVQDNMGNCTNTFAVVSGALKTEAGNGLEDANVELDGASPSNPSVNLLVPSDADGNFLFTNVPYNGDYTVTPIKDNDPLNGVSTFDLVLINKHILGIEPLNSPYKMIAADANNSRSITTFDIVELRKLILGIYTELPNNTSWRFVDDAFSFPNPLNPFQTIFPETKQLANLQTDALAENFKAVKVGDVNGNAVTSSLMTTNDRTDGTLLFDVQDRTVKAGEVFTVNFRAAERAVGYQFTLLFPNLEVVDVTPVSADMAMLNFGIFNSENSLTTSFDNERVNGEFAVTFRAKAAGTLSQMLAVSGRITKAEAYSLNRERQAIALRFNGDNGSTVSGLGFELYQNQPNPWMNKTQVGFHLPEATNATLTIFDETGRVLFVQKGEFGKGYNAFTIERALVNTTGVLYYQLETATDSATKKMIQTK